MPTAQERLAAASERAVPVQVGLIDDAVVVGAAPFDVEESVADVGPWLRRPIIAREAVVLERLPATRGGGRPGRGQARTASSGSASRGRGRAQVAQKRPPSRCHAFALHAEGPPVRRRARRVALAALGADGGRWARAPEAHQRAARASARVAARRPRRSRAAARCRGPSAAAGACGWRRSSWAPGLATALACVLLGGRCASAESAAVLAPVAEALLALAAPLEWAGVYVPVLPKPLLELLDAPQAFLLGVESKWIDRGFSPRGGGPSGAGARDRERRGARREPVSAEDLRLPGAESGPDACLAAHGDGDGDAAARARARRVGLQAAEARLQLACAAAVLDLLDPGHDRAAAAAPRAAASSRRRAASSPSRAAPPRARSRGPSSRPSTSSSSSRAPATASAPRAPPPTPPPPPPPPRARRTRRRRRGPRAPRRPLRLPPPAAPRPDDDDDGAPPADAPPPPAPAADAPPDAAADAAAPRASRGGAQLDHVGAPAPPPTRVYRYGTLADLLGVSLAELREALEPPEPPPTNGGTSPRSFARDADADVGVDVRGGQREVNKIRHSLDSETVREIARIFGELLRVRLLDGEIEALYDLLDNSLDHIRLVDLARFLDPRDAPRGGAAGAAPGRLELARASTVTTVALSPDGSRVACGGMDFFCVVWDARRDLSRGLYRFEASGRRGRRARRVGEPRALAGGGPPVRFAVPSRDAEDAAEWPEWDSALARQQSTLRRAKTHRVLEVGASGDGEDSRLRVTDAGATYVHEDAALRVVEGESSRTRVVSVHESLDKKRLLGPGQDKRAKFPTSKAPLSAVFHSLGLDAALALGCVAAAALRGRGALSAAQYAAADLWVTFFYLLELVIRGICHVEVHHSLWKFARDPACVADGAVVALGLAAVFVRHAPYVSWGLALSKCARFLRAARSCARHLRGLRHARAASGRTYAVELDGGAVVGDVDRRDILTNPERRYVDMRRAAGDEVMAPPARARSGDERETRGSRGRSEAPEPSARRRPCRG
ncbi:Rab guanyl-nucleotide exchange factor [Aureococcus anophagefferens]|nr:Rab guanyl-nucleotide exchange factor [Aureococcus anophagefferens]